MMQWIRDWLQAIIAAALILTVCRGLLPKGSIRTVARMTGGLIMILVILRPLLGANFDRLQLRYRQYEQQLQQQIETYEQTNQEQLRAIIAEKTGAYIANKAAALGMTCHPEVTVRWRDGAPYPCEVALDTERNEMLSRCMTDELGIPPEKQHWRASG